MNALKDPKTSKKCTEKIACQFGDMVRSFSRTTSWLFPQEAVADWLMNMAGFVIPKQSFPKFSRSFRSVVDGTDRSSCKQVCLRCIKL